MRSLEPRRPSFVVLLVMLGACTLVAGPALAQGQPPPGVPPAIAQGQPPGSRGDGLPSIEEATKDMKRVDAPEGRPGLLSLFQYEGDRSRDPERLLALISNRALNQELLFATSISKGGFTGYMWDDYLIRFEVRGRQVAIVLPEVRYPARPDSEVSEVVQKTYNARILATAPLLAMSGSGEPLIDLGPLLKSNLAGLPSGGGVRGDLSKWTKKKVFEDNVLLEVELAVGFGQSVGLQGVAYAFRGLPGLGSYSPRVADDRVGYFLTARRDWTKKHDVRDTFDRYLNRWNLQKKDPSLELSPPVQPIVFYIEKTVPIQWRRWVRQGIEVWNEAFEKIGFTGAIEVRQQTHDNEYAKHDPEDARYNFFRWIVSGRPFAMGPSRTDPRTGQILDADIIFDDSMVRYWTQEFKAFTPRAVAEAKGPGFREFMKRHPSFRIPLSREAGEEEPEAAADFDRAREMMEAKFAERGQRFCDFSIGMQQQMALAYYAAALKTGAAAIPERLIGEAIRETTAHEVGHTLGLRHNFKASSWLGFEELQRRRSTDEPTSASVMDYNPILFFPHDSPQAGFHFVTPTIGPYDYWAIEYGYKVPGPQDKGEADMLTSIAARCATPGLAYATDEDTFWVYSPDPLVNRWDMGSDAFRWVQERIRLVDDLLPRVAEAAAQPGDSRYYVTQAFETLLFEKGTCLSVVSRWVGGQHYHRDHRGDPSGRAPFVLVPAEKQREALKLISENLFRDSFFNLSPDLLNGLAPSRWSHWGSSLGIRLDYPIHDRIRQLQWYTLIDLMAPPVLHRLYDAELKTGESERFTTSELLATIQDAVWAPLSRPPQSDTTAARPFLSSITRSLQREHLEILLQSVLEPADGGDFPPDLHAIACGSARDLAKRLAAVDVARADAVSRAHLAECRSRLERALEAQFQRRG